MNKKFLLIALLSFISSAYSLGAAAWQANEIQECPTNKRNAAWLDCAPEDAPAKLPYKMKDGSVKVLQTRGTVFCDQGTCEYQYQRDSGLWDSTDEYAGQIQQTPKTPVVLLRGYYLGNAEDGRIVAYLKGTGPEVGGRTAPALQKASTSSSNKANIDSCVDQWGTAFHKENGEDAMVISDMLDEWGNWCKAGKHP
ncbi:hypothetical protein QN391_12660 [Pseudomonas sp. CCI1.2]|uniref:hypothetical protein n=1 Tax=Pseudomonas sp. CCI1.2 TaxID=3048614 RepID=UPI002B22953D|nr:hypothetical protein [Pseudomonas sp. CCI1.2]MEB0121545.1 hypothetical protein [Pseudomonas sp. CCI1.2]